MAQPTGDLQRRGRSRSSSVGSKAPGADRRSAALPQRQAQPARGAPGARRADDLDARDGAIGVEPVPMVGHAGPSVYAYPRAARGENLARVRGGERPRSTSASIPVRPGRRDRRDDLVTRHALHRRHAGVPEVWRYHDARPRIIHLAQGALVERDESAALPGVTAALGHHFSTACPVTACGPASGSGGQSAAERDWPAIT
jgi:hypothetical protein